MSEAPVRKRTRLTPQVRRGQILNAAANLILSEGLSALTMERLAREIGISKALVYNYFASREALLEALLRREQDDLRDRGMAAAMRAATFDDLIRQTTRLYLEQTRDRGALIATITADPNLAQRLADASRLERERTVRYFARTTGRAYGLEPEIAATCVDLLMTVTGGAGRLVAEGRMDMSAATELCVTLIAGALERTAGRPASPLH